jgi:HD-GYP domain-containing protein (c-di-GMP phosphodiesterase class II)
LKGVLAHLWRVNRDLLVLLTIVGVTGIINFFVVHQRAFLNLYYLPVVIGTYLLGRRKGVFAALQSCAIVYAIALMNSSLDLTSPETLSHWLDLMTWGCFLVLTAYVTGSLYDVKESQLRDIRHAYVGILEIMAKFIDSVDRYTENHSRRVADHAVRMAHAMQLPANMVEDVRVGAFLHDIGKVDVSVDVLRKAAGLTPEEFEQMQRHVDKGEELIRSVGGILKHVIPMVAFHHERWDGTGYKGLRGEEIPLGARIIAVADTYDAIVTNRAYRPGRSHEEAIAIIQAESGKQLDPVIVNLFVSSIVVEPDSELMAA